MALFYLLLLVFICSCNAQSADPVPIYEFCNDDAKINSTQVSANIDNLLVKLVSMNILIQDSFSMACEGKDGDKVYGLTQCRGDLSHKDCLSCIQDATTEISKYCPYEAGGKIWYEYCFLRYDKENFFGKLDNNSGIIISEEGKVTDPHTFKKELWTLLDKIKSEAIMPGNKSFATGMRELSPFSNLYALVQCNEDLSEFSCSECLDEAISELPNVCIDTQGCRAMYSACRLRYEVYPFFFLPDPQEKLLKGQMKNYSSMVFKP